MKPETAQSCQTDTLSSMQVTPHSLDTCVCAIGVFDGVHLGHQALLKDLTDDAIKLGAESVAVTFDRDPDELFCPDKVHKLLTNTERIQVLDTFVDSVLSLRFSPELAHMEYGEFLDYLLSLLPGLKVIHVGENFRCGARALGGIAEISSWAEEHGITVVAHTLYLKEGVPVSSSRIRGLLAEGKVSRAAEFLSRPFALTGHVVPGAGRGSGLGFATANVEVEGTFAMMGPYVYAAYALIGESRYKAAVSIGEPPTFSPESREFDPFLLEAHLLDFKEDLYGQDLKLEFIENLRPMQRFANREELITTVMGNIAWVRENL